MIFLVDANVLSEPTKPLPDSGVIAWLQRNEANLVIDPIVLGEVRVGITQLPKGKRRAALERWFDDTVGLMECVPLDGQTAMHWADLLLHLRVTGQAMPIKDSLIAATAIAHGFTVVTRNTTDFEKAGVEQVNPFTPS